LHSLANLHRFNLTIFDSSAGMVCTHTLVQLATLEELNSSMRSVTANAVYGGLMELLAAVNGDIAREQVLRNSFKSLANRSRRRFA